MNIALQNRPKVTAIFVLVFGYFAVLSAPSPLAAQSDTQLANQSDFSDVREWIALHEELRRHIDRSFIDLEAAIEVNDYDATSIQQFVSAEIAFQQYPGVLRGAEGTLQTRAGNALDQSILLANLLRDAGYDARIVRANIDLHMSNTLMNQLSSASVAQTVYKVSASPVLVRIAKFLQARGTDAKPDETEWDKEFEKNRRLEEQLSSAIKQALADRDIGLDSQSIPKKILEESQDYYWCQFRDGSSAEWQNAHPVFENTPIAFAELQPEEIHADSIPEALQQRISFQFYARRKIGGKSEQTALTEPWSRPVANLYTNPVSFSLVPSQASVITDENYDISSDIFVPFLNGSMAPGAKAFDLNGNFVPADAAFSNMAGVFRTVSDKGISAATALQGLGSTENDPASRIMNLEDVWLEIRLTYELDDIELVWRRTFRSEAGSAPPTGNSLAKKIIVNLQPDSLSPSPAYDSMLNLHIEALKHSVNQLQSNSTGAAQNLTESVAPVYKVDYSTLDGITEFATLLDIFDSHPSKSITYRPHPLIVASHRSIIPNSAEPEGIDIISNARRSFLRNPEKQLELVPSTTLREGISEALAEHLIMKDRGDVTANAVLTSSDLINGMEPTIITTLADLQGRVGVDQNVQARMKNGLERGRIVVLPNQQNVENNITAWWEVDPKTGETLGMTKNGWGGSYFVMSTEVEGLITRKIIVGTSCIMIVGSTCRMYSQTAVAAIAVAVSGVGWVGCKALFMTSVLSNLPPGTPDICDAIKKGPTYVTRALRGAEKYLYEYCYKNALPECVKAAMASG